MARRKEGMMVVWIERRKKITTCYYLSPFHSVSVRAFSCLFDCLEEREMFWIKERAGVKVRHLIQVVSVKMYSAIQWKATLLFLWPSLLLPLFFLLGCCTRSDRVGHLEKALIGLTVTSLDPLLHYKDRQLWYDHCFHHPPSHPPKTFRVFAFPSRPMREFL